MAAWLRFPSFRLEVLEQTYRRLADTALSLRKRRRQLPRRARGRRRRIPDALSGVGRARGLRAGRSSPRRRPLRPGSPGSGAPTRGARASSAPNAGRSPSPRSRAMPAPSRSKKSAGNSARARWRLRRAASSKMRRERAEAAEALAARGIQTTMSSSGGNAGRKRASAARAAWTSRAAARQSERPPANSPAGFERQQALRRPERDGRRSGARAFEADLAQVQLVGAEVGVGGVVLVEPADRGIAEEDAAATVGLQAVLVRVDDDRVRLAEAVVSAAGLGPEVVGETEVAAIGRVRVEAEAVAFAQREDLRAADPRSRWRSSRSSRRRCRRRRARADSRARGGPCAPACRRRSARRGVREPNRSARACSAPATTRRPRRRDGAFPRPRGLRGWPSCRRRRGGRAKPIRSQPNMAASSATASFSIRELSRPPSRAWLFGLSHIASAYARRAAGWGGLSICPA